MTAFRQLGDPVCPECPPPPPCLCEHHGAAYAENVPVDTDVPRTPNRATYSNTEVITSVAITITERCCVVINAAVMTAATIPVIAFEIERPIGTIRTTQEDEITTQDMRLTHHAAWEVLNPGIYTYYLVDRQAPLITLSAAWLKVIASDCEG